MDFKDEQVSEEIEESVLVRCHDPKAEWVNKVHEAAEGEIVICGSFRLLIAGIFGLARQMR